MPGITYEASGTSGDAPYAVAYLMASNLTGGNNTGAGPNAPPGAIYAHDLCVLTTNTNLTAGGIPVVRPLLQADITNTYQQGGANAGVLGVFTEDIVTNASGQIFAQPTFGITQPVQVVFSMPAPSGRMPPEAATGRHHVNVIVSTSANIFKGRLAPNYAAGATHALDGTTAGIQIVTTNGVSTYYVDPAATTKILTILKPDETDRAYNVASGSGLVFFQFLPTYSQYVNGLNYSTN